MTLEQAKAKVAAMVAFRRYAGYDQKAQDEREALETLLKAIEEKTHGST